MTKGEGNAVGLSDLQVYIERKTWKRARNLLGSAMQKKAHVQSTKEDRRRQCPELVVVPDRHVHMYLPRYSPVMSVDHDIKLFLHECDVVTACGESKEKRKDLEQAQYAADSCPQFPNPTPTQQKREKRE